MNDEKFYELSAKVLSNEASESEHEEMNRLLYDNHYNEQFSIIKKRWHSQSDVGEPIDFNRKAGFEKLTEKIKKYESDYGVEQKKNPILYWFIKNRLVQSIASIAFLIIAGYYLLSVTGVISNQESITWNDKSTASGQISIITLFDGTRITLNSESKLKYPGKFGTSTREVYLEGEAYFEVKSNPSQPFVVHSDNISTVVLGTKFNVKAYNEEKEIKVSLVEGKVKVENKSMNFNKEPVYLKANEQLSFYRNSGTVILDKFSLVQTIGWKDNILLFDNEPLEKVFIALRRSYGVQFELEDTTFNRLKIKANFENESFWTIIKVIKNATNLEYKTVSKNNELQKIIFYQK
ncbi:MAG: FecR domain-containing protein [Melioribacteraceae bacterium]|nr:FecR domain-containing protein [Melioribacteraceae bacterium]